MPHTRIALPGFVCGGGVTKIAIVETHLAFSAVIPDAPELRAQLKDIGFETAFFREPEPGEIENVVVIPKGIPAVLLLQAVVAHIHGDIFLFRHPKIAGDRQKLVLGFNSFSYLDESPFATNPHDHTTKLALAIKNVRISLPVLPYITPEEETTIFFAGPTLFNAAAATDMVARVAPQFGILKTVRPRKVFIPRQTNCWSINAVITGQAQAVLMVVCASPEDITYMVDGNGVSYSAFFATSQADLELKILSRARLIRTTLSPEISDSYDFSASQPGQQQFIQYGDTSPAPAQAPAAGGSASMSTAAKSELAAEVAAIVLAALQGKAGPSPVLSNHVQAAIELVLGAFVAIANSLVALVWDAIRAGTPPPISGPRAPHHSFVTEALHLLRRMTIGESTLLTTKHLDPSPPPGSTPRIIQNPGEATCPRCTHEPPRSFWDEMRGIEHYLHRRWASARGSTHRRK